MTTRRRLLRDLTPEQLEAELNSWGEPSYRTRQVLLWTWRKRAESFDEMTSIAKTTRARLSEAFVLDKMTEDERRVSSAGDAAKFGLRLHESGDLVECVLLRDRQRRTACLSSQLGCSLGCAYCATGAMGFVRNLTQAEVLGQLVAMSDYLAAVGDKGISHVVFMGMGEALLNYEVFAASCRIITADWGFGLGPGRITVSTAGVVPAINRLAGEGPAVNLAISLNAFDDEHRSRIMPINRRYPIHEVIAAGKRFVAATGRSLTFEYVVVHGVNDTPRAVGELVRLLAGVPCKVNCIPLNPTSTALGRAPSYDDVLALTAELHRHGLTATARRSRGLDIDGACGQLAGRRVRGGEES